MLKALLTGAWVLSTALLAGLPMVPAGAAPEAGPPVGLLEAIVAAHGGAPASVVIHRGGQPQEVSWGEFQAALQGTSVGQPATDGPIATSKCTLTGVTGLYCGPDAGAGIPGGSPPFCDDSSGWVVHRGPPMAAFLNAVANGPVPPICGGFFGPAYDWEAALGYTQDPALLQSVMADGADGCYAAQWLVHENGVCPNPYTGGDTFLHQWQVSGPGVVTSIVVGGLTIDYFLGRGAQVAYDLPGDVVPPIQNVWNAPTYVPQVRPGPEMCEDPYGEPEYPVEICVQPDLMGLVFGIVGANPPPCSATGLLPPPFHGSSAITAPTYFTARFDPEIHREGQWVLTEFSDWDIVVSGGSLEFVQRLDAVSGEVKWQSTRAIPYTHLGGPPGPSFDAPWVPLIPAGCYVLHVQLRVAGEDHTIGRFPLWKVG